MRVLRARVQYHRFFCSARRNGSRLGDGAAEDVLALVELARERVRPLVRFVHLVAGELLHGANSENLEIGQRGGSHTRQDGHNRGGWEIIACGQEAKTGILVELSSN